MARRSVLFTPGDRPEMLRKAPESDADVLVFDLEDAVAPGRKDDARQAIRDVLIDPTFDPDCEVCVRVNATPDAIAADLDGVLGVEIDADESSEDAADDADVPDATSLRLDAVMLPKVESATAVRTLADDLESYALSVPIFALVETAAGVLGASEIAAVPATDALAFGAEDLAADIGATRTAEGIEVLYARERVVLAAAGHDCTAIDTLVTDFEDEDALRDDTALSRQLGYDGKLAIHPAQVGPINEAFTPSAEEREWARRVLDAADAADADERGVFEVDGEMIDAPLIARAERVRDRAIAADEWH